MKEINYSNYPLLLFTSFDKDDAPPDLPFEVVSEDIHAFLSGSKGFQEMFALIAVKNTLAKENTNTHFSLDDNIFHQIDSDDFFRNKQFNNFFAEYIKPKHGVILFKDGGQYVYMLLGHKETEKLKNRKGRYIAVALFAKNHFIGFEEGYITEKGISVEHTGHYEGGMAVGGYISFTIITLAYAENRDNIPLDTSVKESIIQLQ